MDFQLSEDQLALQQGLRSFCEGRVPVEQLAELEKTGGIERALWREVAEMGVFELCRPESEGGVGLGVADAVLVFAELGRRLVPGPLVWSHLAAGRLEGVGGGDRIVGGLDLFAGCPRPLILEHLAQIDDLLVLRPQGVFRIDPEQIEGDAVETPLDPLTPIHTVSSLPDGEPLGDADDARRMRLAGAALVSAQLLGIAEATLELAVAYAKTREQFGRPIGSFQAIKHMLADMFVRQEVCRAAVYAAGATFDDPGVGDLQRAVASAKLTAGDAALQNARACIQVHGGMGYTWEVPAHYYLKRCWVYTGSFGSAEEHSEQVARRLESAATAGS